jgi:hypothetical protein
MYVGVFYGTIRAFSGTVIKVGRVEGKGGYYLSGMKVVHCRRKCFTHCPAMGVRVGVTLEDLLH